MKKLIISLIALAIGYGLWGQGALRIESSTYMTATGTVQISLSELHWQQDGLFNPAQSTVVIRGTAGNQEVGGAQPPSFHSLHLDKNSGQTRLNQPTLIRQEVRFLQGNLDLNGQGLYLDDAATLEQESETARVLDQTGGGFVQISLPLNAPSALDPGNLGFSITSTANLGQTSIIRSHDPPSVNGAGAIERYFEVNPTNNSSLNATVEFSYFDAELNGLNESNFRLYQSNDNGLSWNAFASSSHTPTTNTVQLTGLSELARLTVSNQVAFPVSWLGVSAAWVSGKTGAVATISWETASEEQSDRFLIIRRIHGQASEWAEVGSVPAAGNSHDLLSYKFEDGSAQASADLTYEYRVIQLDLDGQQHPSPSVQLAGRPTLEPRLFVYPNPAREVATISVQLPEQEVALLFQVVNSQGQLIYQEALNPVHVLTRSFPVSQWPPGVYTLRISTSRKVLQSNLSILH